MNNFDDVLAKSFFEMMEKCYDSLEKDSWQSFCTELRDGLNNIGLRIMKQMLEQVNLAFKDDQSLRPEWVVERNGDLKSILTVFGKLEYQRTYYRHKRTGRCAYLADMFAGYTAHQKLDPLLETQLVEHASEMSYAKAGKQAECHAKDTVVTDTT